MIKSKTPLADVRRWLMKHRLDGVRCPCCDQYAKVYKRMIGDAMARGIMAMYREHGTEFGYLPDVRRKYGLQNKAESLLRYWGLIEERPARRTDGGHTGWWRVTEFGERFVLGKVRVSKYVFIYNGECIGKDKSVRVSIQEALGKKFNYNELMNNKEGTA